MTGLVVDGLDVTFGTRDRPVHAVRDVSFRVGPGECLALIGESGSGKSVTARTLLGLTGSGATVSARELSSEGTDLRALSETQWRALRGRAISLVLQDAMVALDPLRRSGSEIAEAARTHAKLGRAETRAEVLSLLGKVGVPEPERRARQYPHELSGGLRQRALIAAAIAAGPRLLLADEPTTALDATVQAQVLDLLGELRGEGMSLLLISHDLTVVARLADRVAVMYGGRIVETGPAGEILAEPRHPYTRALLAAVPAGESRNSLLAPSVTSRPPAGEHGCPYAARCSLSDDRCREELPAPVAAGQGHGFRCWHPPSGPVTRERQAAPSAAPAGRVLVEAENLVKRFRAGRVWHDAVRDVSFRIHTGEVLGVVGESGSGKSTTARMVLGLTTPDEGRVSFDGLAWSELPERARRRHRSRLQPIQQNALGSFDPRLTVEGILGEAVARAGVPRGARRARIAELLDHVGLSRTLLGRRPRELSGGQGQRVGIARALAPSPELIVCDEPVSALDVSIQAQILDLLATLRHELGLALLFISHDLGVIHHLSDRILVMKDGRVVEEGDAARVFAEPRDPYTRELLAVTTLRPGADPSPPGGRVLSLPG
ncbi:ABC transporter ATP-binding protein [Amycolatopsis sp.]|uniref:ABC transporter ATP-binding protein n=1 Tax=Amycolatopsis sp. TaxID=37632 RepID=UPI002B6FF9AC|nr:ABC transporter ATP-binding protein [Amycolatopsis sp.]HVV11356.1 ABC transporter ATP-binding protein [Amycolatopsis sp.]